MEKPIDNNNKNNINNIIKTLREDFIIIGLTGSVGSGCTTTAQFLSQEKINYEDILKFVMVEENIKDLNMFDDLEQYRARRIMWFYNNKGWEKFNHIRVSNILLIIFLYSLKKKYTENLLESVLEFGENKFLIKDIFNINRDKEAEEIEKIKKDIENLKIEEFVNEIPSKDNKDFKVKKFLEEINNFVNQHVNKRSSYTKLFQNVGKFIRSEGEAFPNSGICLINEFGLTKNLPYVFIIPEIIAKIIEIYRKNSNEKFFVIDALRNVYEIEYFKHKYNSFYLFSILSSEEVRKERIFNNFKLSEDEYIDIKSFEESAESEADQNINACIGKGDIFINNDFNDFNNTHYKNLLYYQLIKYISLIRYPALFTPTTDERFMQVALTARYSSGCISRQVGAVVIGNDGYIRGFGWNDVPENHIPCVYRTPKDLFETENKEKENKILFSDYERSDTFISHMKNKYKDEKEKYDKFIHYPFCFKDEQNEIENNKNLEKLKKKYPKDRYVIERIKTELNIKNPTRERALHAEENAFLQIAKVGGHSVKDGTLYTTDSPCQLCSKKIMQLKIKRVVYIDAYPDISTIHTLQSGPEEEKPIFEMFSGAVREAYFKLYSPILGRKDEIKRIIDDK